MGIHVTPFLKGVSISKSLHLNILHLKILHLNNGIYNFKVYRKTTKQTTQWSSKIPKRYKRDIILGYLH